MEIEPAEALAATALADLWPTGGGSSHHRSSGDASERTSTYSIRDQSTTAIEIA